MNEVSFLDTPLFNWVILPFLIFFARICDVSLGTVRIVFISKGKKILAPLLGFFEVLIWLVAVRQTIHNLANIACFFAFAGSFAFGNYVGMIIEEKLAIGSVVIRIITKKEASELFHVLKSVGYGVTSVDAQGATGKVNVIFTVINRTDIDKVIKIINQYNPKAFYSIEEVKSVSEGIFPPRETRFLNFLFNNIFH